MKKQIIPLFRSLNRENNLQSIDLTGSNLLNDGVQHLCSCLPSLNQLKSLNLSLNNINSEGVRYLSNIFVNTQKPVLENLINLNLSNNLLDNDSLNYLSIILKNVKLRSLILSGCNFNDNIFDANIYTDLNLENLEVFDVSYNELNKKSICKFISYLNFKHINTINLSNNLVSESGILKDISFNLQNSTSNLKSLDLSRCKVNDAEIWDFLRLV